MDGETAASARPDHFDIVAGRLVGAHSDGGLLMKNAIKAAIAQALREEFASGIDIGSRHTV